MILTLTFLLAYHNSILFFLIKKEVAKMQPLFLLKYL
jgi:hypothetical protein